MRKILSVAVAMVFSFAVVGCGGGGSKPADKPADKPAETKPADKPAETKPAETK